MGKYLRIKNRGACPRIYLTLLGATSKSDKMQDPTQGGWFGSGTKYAPIAALNLGISVAVMSHDDEGAYCLQYAAESVKLPDKTVKRLVRHLTRHGGSKAREVTDYSLDSCLNWKESIGDDDKKAFRVLREYLRNAVDADPGGYGVEETDAFEFAPEGWTYVYLTATKELRAMLATPARYFKYLASPNNPPPLFRFANGGAYPRSDAKRTRLFSLGTLAFCSDEKRHEARYDYSFDAKLGFNGQALLSEERTFAEMKLVYYELKKMLGSWTDVLAMTDLLKAMVSGDASLEVEALGYGENDDAHLPAKAAWLEAWHRAFGEDAVLSSHPYADELARYTYGKTSHIIADRSLRAFLKACGVLEATQCIPGMIAGQEYRLVADLEDWEQIRLATAVQIMHAEFPESETFPVCIFEPLTDKMKKTLGFTAYGTDPAALYCQRACLRSWNTLIETLTIHECRHGRTKKPDNDRGFTDRADRDLAKLLMEKYGIQSEPDLKAEDITLPSIIVAKP